MILILTYKAKRISEKAPGIGKNYTDLWVIEPDEIYEVPDEENGLGKLKKLYSTEINLLGNKWETMIGLAVK